MWPFKGKEDSPVEDSRVLTGRRGEKLAKKLLSRKGLKILGTNYTCPSGEADIVALDRKAGQIVLVEVKSRTSDEIMSPLSAVNSEKKRRLKKIAEYYLGTHQTGDLDLRFDVVTVILPKNGLTRTEHIPDAF